MKKEELQARAKQLGIEFHHNLGEDKLQAMIQAKEAELKINAASSGINQPSSDQPVKPVKPQAATSGINDPVTTTDKVEINIMEKPAKKEEVLKEPPVAMTKTQLRNARHIALRRDQKSLVRIILRSNDPAEKDWEGKTFKFSNALHTITRYIPFDNENGWHCERGLLSSIDSEMCTKFKDHKLPNGQKVRLPFSIKKYTVEILPSLTKEELAELASEQAARGSID
jgi:hypothetical protein